METQGDKNETGMRRIGWHAVVVGGSLLISLGLQLVAHQTFGQTDVATLLLVLYLAFWSSVLGIGGFLLLAIRWLSEWRRTRVGQAAGWEHHEFLQQDRSPSDPRPKRRFTLVQLQKHIKLSWDCNHNVRQRFANLDAYRSRRVVSEIWGEEK
jgi:hypothetical protein